MPHLAINKERRLRECQKGVEIRVEKEQPEGEMFDWLGDV